MRPIRPEASLTGASEDESKPAITADFVEESPDLQEKNPKGQVNRMENEGGIKGTTHLVADTPYFVLMEENRRIGPKVLQTPGGIECAAFYGFSDKDTYDKYCMNCHLALTPYPLVKAYLRNEAGPRAEGLRLIVLDAAGPREPYLHAATMEAVLEAQENRTAHVNAKYEFRLDSETDAYRLLP